MARKRRKSGEDHWEKEIACSANMDEGGEERRGEERKGPPTPARPDAKERK
jgi:hypothetical protein